MALHQLTPDELSRFENQMVAMDDEVQKLRLLMLNFKDKTGNDTAMGLAMKAIKDRVDAVATLIGVAVAT